MKEDFYFHDELIVNNFPEYYAIFLKSHQIMLPIHLKFNLIPRFMTIFTNPFLFLLHFLFILSSNQDHLYLTKISRLHGQQQTTIKLTYSQNHRINYLPISKVIIHPLQCSFIYFNLDHRFLQSFQDIEGLMFGVLLIILGKGILLVV